MKKTDSYNMNDVNSAEIPEFVYDSLARSLLPVIQQYYESDEGKRALLSGKRKRKLLKKELHKTKREDCLTRQSSRIFITSLQFLR